jgi:hydrogenase expression/formation protein HypE
MAEDEPRKDFTLSCPIPPSEYSHILLGHGGGGKLTGSLIQKLFVPTFKNPFLDVRHDGAVFDVGGTRIAYTTDSYVVQPIFFPGGDIGSLAVYGTVNDLAMCGARPLYLSCGFVIEEGFAIEDLWRVIRSMQAAADSAGVQIVTGDTKVVDRGKGDQLYINTSGVGIIEHDVVVAPERVCPGDVVILSGDIGRHGIAVMAKREGLEFESTIQSDSTSIVDLALGLLGAGIDVHCMRDLTRGGLAAAMIEIAETSRTRIDLDEPSIPVLEEVRGACEILGLDPIHVANEGRCAVFVAESQAASALELMARAPAGAGSCVIGRVVEGDAGLVTMRTAVGGSIIVDLPSGEQLPRIC